MQRRNINTVVYVVTVFIVLAVAAVAIILLRDDITSNSTLLTDSSSIDSVIQQSNNLSQLEHNTSINYPWTLTGYSKTNNNNIEKTISYHDRPISNFISITDFARGGIVTPIIQSTRSNKCTDSNKSLMRFTLVTDNYPVRFVCNFCVMHDICVLFCYTRDTHMLNCI